LCQLFVCFGQLSAKTAHEWGLINRCVAAENLMDETMKIAEKFANGPKSLGLIRQAYWQRLENSFAEQIQLESNLQTEAGQTFDNQEGIAAFLENVMLSSKGVNSLFR
jgi:2-(1,2-epoxy-1,2-dihydrophenyl)acetyl-CoA isomerase